MLAYFVRRILGGAATWLLIAFLFYSWLVPPFISFVQHTPCDLGCNPEIGKRSMKFLSDTWAFDKPWPINYLTWLFDPSGPTVETYTFPGYDGPRSITYSRSGGLAGGFGYSTIVEPGTPVLALYGIDLPTFFAFTLTPIFILMLITYLQRIGRHPLRGYSPAQARRLYSMEPIRLLG